MSKEVEKDTKLDRNLVGIAGVYYVAAKLTQRGYIALVTIRNTRAYDLLIYKKGEKNIQPVQVKTSSSGGFRIVTIDNIDTIDKELQEKITCPFVLVRLNSKDQTQFWILSTKQMKTMIKKDWHVWEHETKHHKVLKTTDVQIIFQLPKTIKLLDGYKDKWENLVRS